MFRLQVWVLGLVGLCVKGSFAFRAWCCLRFRDFGGLRVWACLGFRARKFSDFRVEGC